MKASIYVSLLLISLACFRRADAQLTIFGGPQQNTAHYKIQDVEQETESKYGFMAGAGIKAQMEGPVYFAPLMYYSQKGYKVTYTGSAFPPHPDALNNDVTLHTVELAPLFQVNFSSQPSYMFVRFGPSFAFNVSGKETFDSTGNKPISRDMVFSFGDYSHATVAMNAHLGFQHQSGLTLFAHYGHGLSSLNNADGGPKIFHRSLGLSLGWKLGRKK
ncbi:MAG TPA: porin family protein [Flavipsychrobacter sp.]|nr:porin family protein [Flavipsychrobacter sp.]